MTSNFSWQTTSDEVAELFKSHIAGKTVLVTGVSTNSLGADTVRVIAPHAKTVIVASRSIERAEEALAPLRAQLPEADVRVVSLDLASEKSIRTAAEEILAFDTPIDIVINNAAVPQYSTLHRTAEGLEAQFGANHLGHFLFTSLIFPAILKAAGANKDDPARIVLVSAATANFPSTVIRWDDPNFELRPQEYGRFEAYTESKLGNVLFAKELAKRYKTKNIIAFSLHPGLILNTNMGSTVSVPDLIGLGFLKPDGSPMEDANFKTIPQGTSTQIAAAFDPSLVDHAGAYIHDCVPHDELLNDFGKDEDNATGLWELSEKIWGEPFGLV